MKIIKDAFSERKKNDVMQDTWGHLYPEPGSKHYGEMLVTHGDYGDLTIIRSDFPTIEGSPQRFHVEQTIFDKWKMFDEGKVYRIKCGMWFFKTCKDLYVGKPIGKLINVKVRECKII